jgi:hypothetical protein
MSKSNTFEADFLALVFLNTNIALVGDATGLRGSSAAGDLYFALHSADPGEGGDQQTSEVSYTGYARAAVPRTPVGFTLTGSTITPTSNVEFPVATAGSVTATHFSVGTSSAGAGKILYKGALTPNIPISAGITPRVTTATSITED